MARPRTKTELVTAAAENYKKLMVMIGGMSETELSTEFNFSREEKKKEAHWRRDKNLRDVLIHLHEWHQLLLQWVKANEAGEGKAFLPEEYNWKIYGDMNVMFWKKHQQTPLPDAKKKFIESHAQVMELIERYTDEELFTKGVFTWTGGTTLGSYFISTTSSHYDWAMKKLKAHKKMIVR